MIALKILLWAFMAGLGATTGYYTIYILLANLEAYLKHRAVQQAFEEAQEEEEGPKLCVKCKKNPRPEGGLCCSKCQFKVD